MDVAASLVEGGGAFEPVGVVGGALSELLAGVFCTVEVAAAEEVGELALEAFGAAFGAALLLVGGKSALPVLLPAATNGRGRCGGGKSP